MMCYFDDKNKMFTECSSEIFLFPKETWDFDQFRSAVDILFEVIIVKSDTLG
jgi:hypothetical protein